MDIFYELIVDAHRRRLEDARVIDAHRPDPIRLFQRNQAAPNRIGGLRLRLLGLTSLLTR